MENGYTPPEAAVTKKTDLVEPKNELVQPTVDTAEITPPETITSAPPQEMQPEFFGSDISNEQKAFEPPEADEEMIAHLYKMDNFGNEPEPHELKGISKEYYQGMLERNNPNNYNIREAPEDATPEEQLDWIKWKNKFTYDYEDTGEPITPEGVATAFRRFKLLGKNPGELSPIQILIGQDQSDEEFFAMKAKYDAATQSFSSEAPKTEGNLSREEMNAIIADAYQYIEERKAGNPEDYLPAAMLLAVNELPADTAIGFEAHGIAKGLPSGDLDSLNDLLSSGIDENRAFSTIPLKMPESSGAIMGANGPYADGGFILLGNPNKALTEGIGGVIVNEQFYKAIPKLQEKFPGIKFIPANRLEEDLREWKNTPQGQT